MSKYNAARGALRDLHGWRPSRPTVDPSVIVTATAIFMAAIVFFGTLACLYALNG